MCGFNSLNSSIDGCYNKSAVSALHYDRNYQMSGGICGNSTGNVTNCYNGGTVRGNGASNRTGGIIGELNNGGSVVNCYNYGSVSNNTGNCYGGVVGNLNTTPTVRNTYCDNACSYVYWQNGRGQDGTINIAARTPASNIPNLTVSLGSSFAYDVYNQNKTYPVLAWQNENFDFEFNHKQAYIKQGERLSLNILENTDTTNILDGNYSASNFTWKSTNEDVATVDSNGIVTGLADRIYNNLCI